jgi:peptidoglycan/LPS O-acetylase OafA/YrhL
MSKVDEPLTVPDSDSSPEKPAKGFYLPGLDGLRTIAWSMVMLHHLLPREWPNPAASEELRSWWHAFILANGYGVTLFFVLSSFLITSLLLQEKERFGRIDVRGFYLRRILRIWPLYFLILIAAAVLNGAITNVPLTPATFFRFATFNANLLMSGKAAVPLTIGPLWSVCVEEQFYLCWPWLLRAASRKTLALVACAMVAAGLGFRIWMAGQGVESDVVWFHTFAHLDCFGLGCLAALYLNRETVQRIQGKTAAVFAGLLAIYAVERYLPFKSKFGPVNLESAINYSLVCLVCAGIVCLVASMRGGPLASKPMVWLGRMTFGLYCYHRFVLTAVDNWFPPTNWVPRAILTLAATLLLAWLSFRFYETPFLRLKKRFETVRSGGV